MALPGGLTTVIVTGGFVTPTGRPMVGQVTFTPSATLLDPAGTAVIPAIGTTYPLSSSGTFQTDPLIATDNSELEPQGWAYNVKVELQDVEPYSFAAFLPSSPSTVDLSALEPVYPAGTVLGAAGTYLPSGGGSETGTLVLDASPPLKVPGATSGQILVADGSGNFTAQVNSVGNASAIDGVTVTGTVASGRTIIATDSTHASWALPLQIDTTASDIQPLGPSAVAGNLTQAAAANHVHPITSSLLDATAADIQAPGIQPLAGSTGKAADAGHVHPGGIWVPSDSGLLAANFDPWDTQGAASAMSAGVVYLMQVQIRTAFTWSDVVVMVTTAGSGTSTGCFAGIYSSSGTRVAVSADCASFFTASPVGQYVPLVSTYATSAGTFVWVALLCNLGTTQVSLGKNGIGNQGNMGYSIASNPIYLRAAKYTTTGQTSLPSSFTPSSALASAGETAWWVGAT